ncbi:MAG: universal stress protein [Pseudonocardiales bacterium]|nr:universal stress protein [Pseudonocardiales bacterium]
MSSLHSTPVILGIDDSEPSRSTVAWAAKEASLRGVALEIVHAGYYLLGRTNPQIDPAEFGVVGSCKRAIDEAVASARSLFPGLPVSSELDEGDPVDYLIGQTERAGLIVLGGDAGGRLAGAVFRSITQSVAAHAHCPVVVVNHQSPADAVPRNAVVVGVSPSAGGEAALRFAFQEAQLRGAEVAAVRSWAEVRSGIALMGLDSLVVEDWVRMETRVLKQCVASVAADYPDVKVTLQLREERSQWALHTAAIGAALLVVGAHREDDHWFSRLGPVASWLLHRAPCPISVVGARQATALIPDAVGATELESTS